MNPLHQQKVLWWLKEDILKLHQYFSKTKSDFSAVCMHTVKKFLSDATFAQFPSLLEMHNSGIFAERIISNRKGKYDFK